MLELLRGWADDLMQATPAPEYVPPLPPALRTSEHHAKHGLSGWGAGLKPGLHLPALACVDLHRSAVWRGPLVSG